MAKLPTQTLIAIFNLQRQLVELIDAAKTTEYKLFEEYGETEETISDLEQLQNGTERLRNPYSRLHRLALVISEAQPTAPAAMLDLLAQTIDEASATADAVQASTQETQRIWNLL